MTVMPPNQSAVSGPGQFSKRTDMPAKQGMKNLPDAAYGEQKDFQAIQGGAPMAKTQNQRPNVVPLFAETMRPEEPITAGVDVGPGPGRDILGLPSATQTQLEDLTKIAKYMPLLSLYADSPESTGTMKAFVKYLRSQSE